MSYPRAKHVDPVEVLRELATLEELERVAAEIIALNGENPERTHLLADRAEELVEHLKKDRLSPSPRNRGKEPESMAGRDDTKEGDA